MAYRMSVEALLALPAVAHELRDDALDNQRAAVEYQRMAATAHELWVALEVMVAEGRAGPPELVDEARRELGAAAAAAALSRERALDDRALEGEDKE